MVKISLSKIDGPDSSGIGKRSVLELAKGIIDGRWLGQPDLGEVFLVVQGKWSMGRWVDGRVVGIGEVFLVIQGKW
jgi:hypothetical protein